MPAKPTPTPEFDASILADLACPACHSDLRLDEERLICSACSRVYPIIDGIPALIADRAEMPAKQQ